MNEKGFFSLPPKQYALLSALIGLALIDGLDADQQNSLGNFIVNVGSTMLTAAAQNQLIESGNKKNDQIRQQLEMIKQQIYQLEEEINKF